MPLQSFSSQEANYTMTANTDVLVIGAGPAGIASAYALQQAGISYEVVDRAERVGDTWASLYPSLKLNTTRFFSHMPGKRFPLHYGLFPTGRQYYEYLCAFVAQHNFNITLGVTVQRVAPEGRWWRVESSRGVEHYKAVISATGIFGNPITPEFPGMARFQGECIHSHEFRDPQQIAGKRVLVVGNGPSGVDVSVASSEVAAATYIAIRSGVTLRRRYPLGLPRHGWLLLTQHLPKSWCRWIMKKLGSIGYPQAARYGLLPAAEGTGGMTAYQGPELLNAVKAGRVTPVPTLKRFHPYEVELVDGRCLAVDTVIFATGYRPVLGRYLDIDLPYSTMPWQPPSICDWERGPNGQRGWPLRDTSEHPNGRQVVGYPGLYVVGTFYKGKGAMHNMNIEAAIASEQIRHFLAGWDEKQAVQQHEHVEA